jgi:hypothetical protein
MLFFLDRIALKNKLDEWLSSANVYYILMKMMNIRGSVALIGNRVISSRTNEKNINKARLQLFRTQYYYRREGIFAKSLLSCDLLTEAKTSLPEFYFSTCLFEKDEKRHNVIIHLQNAITIRNEKQINVKS